MNDERGHDEVLPALSPGLQELQERQRLIGELVNASARADGSLRQLFCALIGSPYAAVVSAGQNSGWLISYCKALVSAHREIEESARQSLNRYLADVRTSNTQRNKIVHNTWAYGRTNLYTRLDGRCRDDKQPYQIDTVETSAAELEHIIGTYISASVRIQTWAFETLGASAVGTEARLRWIDHIESLTPEELQAMVETRQGDDAD